jgi:hypothetical protein
VEEVMIGEHGRQVVTGGALTLANKDNAAQGDATKAGQHWGRDLGAVTTRNSSKGALLAEVRTLFRAFTPGIPLDEFREQCLRGTILRQRARETRHRIWEAVHWRFFAWHPPQWVLTEIAEAAKGESTAQHFVGLVYLHYARRDRLTFDFVCAKLWQLWHSGNIEVCRNDVLDFLAAYADKHSQVRAWRETTRKKLAGNVLSALRDFGVLKGVQRKIIQQPTPPWEVVLHLTRLLYGEGLRGRTLLEARDWRLFLWEPHQVADALSQLAQRGKLRFERSGKTVILEIRDMEGHGRDQ